MDLSDILANHISNDNKLSDLLVRLKFRGQIILHVDPNDHKIADVEFRIKKRVKEPRLRNV